jgi:peptide deformylase
VEVRDVSTGDSRVALSVTDSAGCLWVSGRQADGIRAAIATVTGADMQGRQVTVTATGLLARCMQHENDHPHGIVCVDLLPGDERAFILAASMRAANGH